MANLSSIIFWNTRRNLLSWILILKKLPNLHGLAVKISFLCQLIIVKLRSKVSICRLFFCNISCVLKFIVPSLVDCCCLWQMFVFNIGFWGGGLRFFFSFKNKYIYIFFFFILVCSSHCSLIFISKTNKQTCIGFSLCHPWLWIIFMSFTDKYMFLFSF